MKTTLTIRTASMLLGASLAVGPVSANSIAVKAKAGGEIIGIVESGSSRMAYVVVNLTNVSGSYSPPSAPVKMDQKNKEFLPPVLAIMKGTKVRFENSDSFLHNVFSNSPVKTFNVSQVKQGDASLVTFNKIGLVPIRCHIHASMKAVIDVLPNPFFDVTNEKGQFLISGIPSGTYTIKMWSERTGSSTQTVQVTAGERAKVIFKV